MTFVLRLIGIITLACQGEGNDPCNVYPFKLDVYIADGLSSHQPCQSGDLTPTHGAYLRIRSAVSGHWPGRRACGDGSPCWLYPLFQDDKIRIAGVIDGESMMKPIKPTPILQWGRYTTEKLARDAAKRSLASLSISNGTVEIKRFANKMYYTEGTFFVNSGHVRIVAEGTNRHLQVPANSIVDILNLPRLVADSSPETQSHHAGREHFYLHWTLTENPPIVCAGPEDELNVGARHDPDLAGSIACSNSLYP